MVQLAETHVCRRLSSAVARAFGGNEEGLCSLLGYVAVAGISS